MCVVAARIFFSVGRHQPGEYDARWASRDNYRQSYCHLEMTDAPSHQKYIICPIRGFRPNHDEMLSLYLLEAHDDIRHRTGFVKKTSLNHTAHQSYHVLGVRLDKKITFIKLGNYHCEVE